MNITSGRKPQVLEVLKKEHKTVKYSAEIIRYLNWRYGIEDARETGIHTRSFAGLSRNLQKASREEDQK